VALESLADSISLGLSFSRIGLSDCCAATPAGEIVSWRSRGGTVEGRAHGSLGLEF
jgi:hypothetical protein